MRNRWRTEPGTIARWAEMVGRVAIGAVAWMVLVSMALEEFSISPEVFQMLGLLWSMWWVFDRVVPEDGDAE